jgi:alcohol dehydrogenase class IV
MNFNYFQPTEIRFGRGRIKGVGQAVASLGKRCLMVTVPSFDALESTFDKVKLALEEANVKFIHYDGVIPNPTTKSVTDGARMAVDFNADVVLGLGGGSSIDTAKAIAVEVTHEGTCWDYLGHCETQPTNKTLPIAIVSTTSGTGSHVTQIAVVTNSSRRDKSAIFNPMIFPKIAIIDPNLMVTVPKDVTASTGFDVFCHAFEAFIHPAASPFTDMMATKAITIIQKWLPLAIENGSNIEARESMAWADTLGGLCLSNAGVTLPHGIAMAISGLYPNAVHGMALAAIYPNFMRFTWKSAERQFASLARIFDPNLENVSDTDAAKQSCDLIISFINKIGLKNNIYDLGVSKDEIILLAKQSMVLPDYKNNPRLITNCEEMLQFITGKNK